MPDAKFVNLLGVLVIAAVAPLAAAFLPRLRTPAVVLEILLGVASARTTWIGCASTSSSSSSPFWDYRCCSSWPASRSTFGSGAAGC